MTTVRNHYPNEFKDAIAQRYLSSDISYRALADEIGAGAGTIVRWVKNFKEHGMAKKKKRSKKRDTVEERSPQEKLRLVLAAKGLEGEERGAFLRSEGVHDADLQRWEEMALRGLEMRSSSQARRIRELERRTAKQEARLREARALIELQKKVQELWGDEDVDMEGSNG